jgi:hypothetical protein
MDYRVYVIGKHGHFIRVHEIEASDDDEALLQAKHWVDGLSVEVWHRGRRVAHLTHESGSIKITR